MDGNSMTGKYIEELTVTQIMEMIPHRHPFLLIDKMRDIYAEEKAIGIKNVTINEHFFAGHFPDNPIMPGVLIIEAMAQTAGVTVMAGQNSSDSKRMVFFMTVDSARFRKPVVPGETLELHVEKIRSRGNVWKFKGKAKVDGVLKAEAVFTAMVT
jgi:3-hydroxyacyl-[acyl-carrier-protein] dehydratase